MTRKEVEKSVIKRWLNNPELLARHSACVNKIWRIREDFAIGAEMDAGFDAGEWSGPANARAEQVACLEAIETHGLWTGIYNLMLKERTTDKFAHINDLYVHHEPH